MKKYIMSILIIALFVCVSVLKSDAVTITMTIGTQANCNTTISSCIAFPTQVSTLCTAACARRVAPSLTIATRFWGVSTATGGCSTSTDGGTTWGACTVEPFDTGIYVLEGVGSGSDGSVVVAATKGGPLECAIKRSTDNGANWSSVFSNTDDCSSGGIEGQRVICLVTQSCVFSAANNATSTYRTYTSSNNGVNWSVGSTGTFPVGGTAGIAWNGTVGINIPQSTGTGAAKSFSTTGGDIWASSANWPNVGNCWGPYVYNNLPEAICFSGPDYKVYSDAGILVASITLPGALLIADSGGIGYGYATNTMYVAAASSTPNINVYVSRDNLVSFILLGQSTNTVGIRGGNTFLANGCVYFSSGTTNWFGKVC